MAEGKGRHDWNQTAHLLCALINPNLKKGARKLLPQELNPYAVRRKREPDMRVEGVGIFKRLFIDRRPEGN